VYACPFRHAKEEVLLAPTSDTQIKAWAITLAREYARSLPDGIHVPTLARELQRKYKSEEEAREAIGDDPCVADL